MSNNDRFKQLMTIVGANYNRKLGDENITLFATMAKNWGFDEFYNAMMAHMTDPDAGMFFPNMAHIAKHIGGTKKDHHNEIESRANFQWMNVDRAIRECGSYNTPNFKDAVTSAAVSAMGGWLVMCASTTEQLVWKQKEFVRNYIDFSTKPIDQLPSHISGREDLAEQKKIAQKSFGQLLEKFDLKKD